MFQFGTSSEHLSPADSDRKDRTATHQASRTLSQLRSSMSCSGGNKPRSHDRSRDSWGWTSSANQRACSDFSSATTAGVTAMEAVHNPTARGSSDGLLLSLSKPAAGLREPVWKSLAHGQLESAGGFDSRSGGGDAPRGPDGPSGTGSSGKITGAVLSLPEVRRRNYSHPFA